MKPARAMLLYFLCILSAPAADICRKVSETCTDEKATHTVNGLSVYRDCWRYESVYQCENSANPQDTCEEYKAAGCAQIGSECISTEADGTCELYRQTYQCQQGGSTTKEVTVCGNSFCTNGSLCFDTNYQPDADFGSAVAAAEAARLAGIYGVDQEAVNLFNGFMSQCSIKTGFGGTAKSCCSAKGGGEKYSNHIVRNTVIDAAWAVVKEEGTAGAKWVWDALSKVTMDWINGLAAQGVGIGADAASSLTTGLADTAASAAVTNAAAEGGTDAATATAVNGAAAAGTEFGAYGFTFSYTAGEGFSFVAFDPWSFAIAVVITIVMDWLTCSAEDALTSMRKGQNLCSYIGSYCETNSIGLTCTNTMEQYCCFNSVLAKLINRQGRTQLGLTQTECGGFSVEQLAQLDFSTMDFSEFINTLYTVTPDHEETMERVTTSATEELRSYYE